MHHLLYYGIAILGLAGSTQHFSVDNHCESSPKWRSLIRPANASISWIMALVKRFFADFGTLLTTQLRLHLYAVRYRP